MCFPAAINAADVLHARSKGLLNSGHRNNKFYDAESGESSGRRRSPRAFRALGHKPMRSGSEEDQYRDRKDVCNTHATHMQHTRKDLGNSLARPGAHTATPRTPTAFVRALGVKRDSSKEIAQICILFSSKQLNLCNQVLNPS